ncbi:MAG TPA: prephenate dehydrogenase/arogenate dehydrogenase family protein [bacterium]|nr:prephenate dehydrogenase/arogenate dehydrogenase family protein [bacterium]
MVKFKNTGIVGLGIIGGSLAVEIKKRKISERVTGFSRRTETLARAMKDGIIDEYFPDFEEGLRNLDFLILATPIDVIKEYFVKISRQKSSVLVTDVASVKEKIVKESEEILGKNSNFVPSHPMAGSEKSGIESIKENLFEGRNVIITPGDNTKEKNILKVKNFWEALGAKTLFLSPCEHDRLIGLTSHLPHVAVYCLISLLRKAESRDILFKCMGTGFLDTTRIGKSNPELWASIFAANRINICCLIDDFEKALREMKNILENDSCEKLIMELKNLKTLREKADEKN